MTEPEGLAVFLDREQTTRYYELYEETPAMSTTEDFMRKFIDDYDTTALHYAYSLPSYALTFRSFPELRKAVVDSGSHFFDKDAMEFFNSRIQPELFGNLFFITSEAMDDGPREYSVRWVYRVTESDYSTPKSGVCLQVDRFNWRGKTLDEARSFAKSALVAMRGGLA